MRSLQPFFSFVSLAFCALSLLPVSSAEAQATGTQRPGVVTLDYVMLDRELTLDEGTVEVAGRLQVLKADFGFFNETFTTFAATLGYGVSDALEIWGEPVLQLSPDAELGLNLGVALRAINGESFDMAPSFTLPMNLTGGGDTISSFSVGLDSRLELSEVVSLLVLHDLLRPTFGFQDTVFINANLGLGVDLGSFFAMRFETRVFSVETAGGNVASYGDLVPFGVDALLAIGPADLFAGLAFPDLGNAGDLFVLTLGAAGRF